MQSGGDSLISPELAETETGSLVAAYSSTQIDLFSHLVTRKVNNTVDSSTESSCDSRFAWFRGLVFVDSSAKHTTKKHEHKTNPHEGGLPAESSMLFNKKGGHFWSPSFSWRSPPPGLVAAQSAASKLAGETNNTSLNQEVVGQQT